MSSRNTERYFSQDITKSTVFDLVYRYLSKIADRNERWKQRNCACNAFQRKHARRKSIHQRTLIPLTDFDNGISNNNKSKSRMGGRIVCKMFKPSRKLSKQCIDDYKGITGNGRKHTKYSLQEALLCGLRYGFLILIDQQVKMLRISPKLGFLPLKNVKEDE